MLQTGYASGVKTLMPIRVHSCIRGKSKTMMFIGLFIRRKKISSLYTCYKQVTLLAKKYSCTFVYSWLIKKQLMFYWVAPPEQRNEGGLILQTGYASGVKSICPNWCSFVYLWQIKNNEVYRVAPPEQKNS